MEIALNEEDGRFRDEVRDFLAREIPRDWPHPPGTGSFEIGDEEFPRLRAWQRKLFDARLIGITWPSEYGGRDAPPHHDAILQDEMVRAGA
ncbi:acyl-CoA dehydrogenase family protein, partial [bacterium]|nr:acyl-CoA dehydrogenase family protein [bacterium]